MAKNQTQMATFHVPDDVKVLEQLGRISVRHGHLDYVLRLVIKTLTETSLSDALDATVRENSSSLRERIRRLAKAKLGDGPVLIQLQALVERARRVTEKRNALMHNLYAKEVDGNELIREDDHSWTPIPTFELLQGLEIEIASVQEELSELELNEFRFADLRVAIDARKEL